jgi:hypothetical protein
MLDLQSHSGTSIRQILLKTMCFGSSIIRRSEKVICKIRV